MLSFFFFFNDTATTEIYTLSLHDALPIWIALVPAEVDHRPSAQERDSPPAEHESQAAGHDRHRGCGLRSEEHTSELQSRNISYAVFCLKKKKTKSTLN